MPPDAPSAAPDDPGARGGGLGTFASSSEWTGAKVATRVKRLLSYLLFSALAHGLLLVLVLLIDFSTHIGDIYVNWSDRKLSGIGMASDPTQGDPQDGDGAALTAPIPQEVVALPPPKPPTPPEPVPGELDPNGVPVPPLPPPPEDPQVVPPQTAVVPGDKAAQDKEGTGQHPGESLPGLAAYGPGNVRVIFVIRSDRLRGTEYEQTMRGLLKRFPDYQVTLRDSPLDPVDDFKVSLIASNNLQKLEQTFVAIRHDLPDQRLMDIFSKHYIVPLTWGLHLGRPHGVPDPSARKELRARELYLPEPGLALLIQTDLLQSLSQPSALIKKPDGTIIKRSWLDTLRTLEDIDTLTGSKPAVFVSVRDFSLRLNASLPDMPPVISLAASITPEATPHLTLKLEFKDAAEATSFRVQWPAFVRGVVSLSPLLIAVEGTLSGFTFAQDGVFLYGEGKLPGWVVKLGLDKFRDALPDIRP
jgi:hypothetical protein